MSKKKKAGNIKEEVASNVKTIREKAGLSREELAAKANVSARYIYVIESGKRNVSIETLETIAKALDSTVSDIVCTPDRPANSREESLELAVKILQKELMSTKERHSD